MTKHKFYTKHYKDGDVMIFQYIGKAKDKDMVKVSMFLSSDKNFEYETEVYIGFEGTSKDAVIKPSTKKETDLIVATHYKEAYNNLIYKKLTSHV